MHDNGIVASMQVTQTFHRRYLLRNKNQNFLQSEGDNGERNEEIHVNSFLAFSQIGQDFYSQISIKK